MSVGNHHMKKVNLICCNLICCIWHAGLGSHAGSHWAYQVLLEQSEPSPLNQMEASELAASAGIHNVLWCHEPLTFSAGFGAFNRYGNIASDARAVKVPPFDFEF